MASDISLLYPVAPSRERELKQNFYPRQSARKQVAPSRERELKLERLARTDGTYGRSLTGA